MPVTLTYMERVTGIGGFFFKAREPDRLARWYEYHLGIDAPPTSYDESSWRQGAGPTVFAAMTADSEHFSRESQQWALNFRVRDLDAMVTQLRAAGVDVSIHPMDYPKWTLRRPARPGRQSHPALGARGRRRGVLGVSRPQSAFRSMRLVRTTSAAGQ